MGVRTTQSDFLKEGSVLSGVDAIENSGSLQLGSTFFPSSKVRGFWRGNETSGSTWADSSMWVRGPGFAPWALNFDGVDDIVQVNDAASLKPSSISLEAMIYLRTSPSVTKTIVAKIDSSTTDGYALQLNGSGQLTFTIATGSVFVTVTGSALTTNKWVHVAGTYDGTSKDLKLYIDGVEVASDTSSNPTLSNTTEKLTIGSDLRNATPEIDAAITDVRAWDDERTASEIANNKDAQLVGNEANLVGYWKCDEGTGLTVGDSTANANTGTFTGQNDGTINGSPSFTDSGFRERINFMDFDGTDDDVTNDSISTETLTEVTIQAWCKFDANSIGDGGSSANEIITLNNTASEGLDVFSSGTNQSSGNPRFEWGTSTLTGNTTLNSGEWNHIMGVYDGSTIKLYVNGILDNSTAETTDQAITNIDIGGNIGASTKQWAGNIANVSIMHKAITPDSPEYDGQTAKFRDRGVNA